MEIICHSSLHCFGYGRTSGQIKIGAKSDGICPSEVGGCILVAGGDTKSNNGNGNAFFVKRGGGVARRWQWWGNRGDGLVLKVHMGK